MICPCCDTINNDEAKVCRNCGIRLTGRRARPEDEEREKKYLMTGIATVVAAIAFLVLVFTLSSCICSGCNAGENAGENVITDEVGGEYFDDTVSAADVLSGSDVSGADVSPADVPAEQPAE